MNYKSNKISYLIMLIFLTIIIIYPKTVFAINYNNICNEAGVKNTMSIIGYVILVCRWIIPLVIIALGMFDFSKAVVSNDDKAVNKAIAALIRRVVTGLAIFFIPTIILALLNVTINSVDVTTGENVEIKIKDTNFGTCTKCLFDPGSCTSGSTSGSSTGGGGPNSYQTDRLR